MILQLFLGWSTKNGTEHFQECMSITGVVWEFPLCNIHPDTSENRLAATKCPVLGAFKVQRVFDLYPDLSANYYATLLHYLRNIFFKLGLKPPISLVLVVNPGSNARPVMPFAGNISANGWAGIEGASDKSQIDGCSLWCWGDSTTGATSCS